MARSATKTPFLRDHAQYTFLARGGTVLRAQLEEDGDEQRLVERVWLTEPWMVGALLKGNLDRLSVGLRPQGKVICTACNAEWRHCYHWPGRHVANDDGTSVLCELELENAQKIETSAVNRPAVEGTVVGEPTIRNDAGGAPVGKDPAMADTPKTPTPEPASEVLALAAKLAAAEHDRAEAEKRAKVAEEILAAERKEAREGAADRWLTSLADEHKLENRPALRAHLRALYLAGDEKLAAELAAELTPSLPFSEPQRHRAKPVEETAASEPAKTWAVPMKGAEVDLTALRESFGAWPKSVRERVTEIQRISSSCHDTVAGLIALQRGGGLDKLLAADGYKPLEVEVR